MLKGVGLTALLVAQARAVESQRPDRLFDDPFAAAFVAAAGPEFAAAAAEYAPILALRGDGGHFALRARFFDDWVLDASTAGCRQVVVLGAGLDTRAYRLAWPEGVRLFELDLPDVLAFKGGVLVERSAAPKCRRVAIPADLREDWPQALVAAGFLAGHATAWLAEGLLMYLSEDERDRLLDRVGKLSAVGSRLALDQRGATAREPEAPPAGSPEAGPENLVKQARSDAEVMVARLGVHLAAGTPDLSMADPESWLTRHGWQARVYSAADRFALYGRPVPPALAAGTVQLWLASAERV